MSPIWLKCCSWLALSLVLLPSLVFFGGMIDHGLVKLLAIAGTLTWFPVTFGWMGVTQEAPREDRS
ncbi:MAG: hypothetical protein AAGD07_08860 [Planctomycetota bacterium]